jgi:transketolase N-terminal domain/subunit
MKETLNHISNLVERFERNIEAYHSPVYNETQLRIEFVDPFFEALGWDVTNKEGHAEQYKDVIHEDARLPEPPKHRITVFESGARENSSSKQRSPQLISRTRLAQHVPSA